MTDYGPIRHLNVPESKTLQFWTAGSELLAFAHAREF